MDHIFLYQQWVREQVEQFYQGRGGPTLRGQPLRIPVRCFAAALMQGYLGKATLQWISALSAIPTAQLRRWRQEPAFLLVMDWTKARFATATMETLILSDFSLPQYHYITGEISLLEESLRLTLRVPLYDRFKKIGQKLLSQHANGLEMERYDLQVCRRLLLFFLSLENYWPTKAGIWIRQDLLSLAREVIWPAFNQKFNVEPALAVLQQDVPRSQVQLLLAQRLREVFALIPADE